MLLMCLPSLALAQKPTALKRLNDLAWYPAHVAKMKGHDKLVHAHIGWHLRSSIAGVKPGDIVLTIHAKDGPIVIDADSDGQVSLPSTKALYRENPSVSFNQPTGTVQAVITQRYSAKPRNIFSYGMIQRLDREYETVQVNLGFVHMMTKGTREPDDLIVAFGEGAKAKATVSCRKHFAVMSDSDGLIRIPYTRKIPHWCLVELDKMPKAMYLEFTPPLSP